MCSSDSFCTGPARLDSDQDFFQIQPYGVAEQTGDGHMRRGSTHVCVHHLPSATLTLHPPNHIRLINHILSLIALSIPWTPPSSDNGECGVNNAGTSKQFKGPIL